MSSFPQQPLIAVIRAETPHQAQQMAETVAQAGLTLIEITWNTPQAPQVISQLRARLPRCQIGTGTILQADELRDAVAAGSQFIFTPHVDRTLIQQACAAQIPIIPGALTPSEIIQAWATGATCVKVFPIQAVGGVNYLRALQGPLGHIPLIPTGGVNLDNAQDFLQAGAIAVGLSSSLFPKHLVIDQDWAAIYQLAVQLQTRLGRAGELHETVADGDV
ncbi:bifunctional 4-hydroxy-2-oxoglutarate aldolase/2-dehydro-3-deoxy-phosphogluconate aldolase [Synechococcus sp. PCC 6312]|uniref:bifunctional 4-hydroxy-2-oxoglutarate aldolase/2-dehydro-3-deoxy-phosphogluconate aldolase n=1 Tax=Synechococcus sp. (strain ATCC 27167 / PCC 6312) TaxID=195253 RepID=UPI00029F1704|nr:bifunctional 4-hydroxy-2-oxoglutarate aldolase/2-dehydro-3-deoxy-phosphogluconate aldolase [Synechococcus sp. PCC 6312]AFY61703.1 2-keto-3-deoxy-phosphogluconate aldolase [Synechococcus sp. PCC 6312]